MNNVIFWIIASILFIIGYIGETLYQNYNNEQEQKKIKDLEDKR